MTRETMDKATCLRIREWLNEIALFWGALYGTEVRAGINLPA